MSQRIAQHIVAIGGGKGGVGKSIVATNLAVAMAQSGSRVVLVDADLGAANLHTLFGIEKPGPSIQSFIDKEVDSLEAARVATDVANLSLVRGTTATVGAANLGLAQKQRLLRHIEKLDADVVLIDVGAGTAYNQLDLFDAADHRLLVMTPQLTSVQNAYAFLKGAVYRSMFTRLKAAGHPDLTELENAGETARIGSLLKRTHARSPELAEDLYGTLINFGVTIFGNNVFDARDSGVFRSVGRMMSDFLGVSAPLLGFARASRAIHESVNRRRPYLLDALNEDSATALRDAARALLASPGARASAPQPQQALAHAC